MNNGTGQWNMRRAGLSHTADGRWPRIYACLGPVVSTRLPVALA